MSFRTIERNYLLSESEKSYTVLHATLHIVQDFSLVPRIEMTFSGLLNHLKTMCIWVIVVNFYGIVAINFCPAFNTRDNGIKIIDLDNFFYPPGKFSADDTFMNKRLTYF